MTFQFARFLGMVRYEFRMQIRRRSLWITFAAFTVYAFLVSTNGVNYYINEIKHGLVSTSLLQVVAGITSNGQQLLPLVVGCLLADRLKRDQRIRVDELLDTTSASLHMRLLGKYVGSLLASLVPLLLVYALFQGFVLVISHNLLVIPYFLLTFLTISLPGLLFVAAFSIAIPLIMPVALYQFLFTCYWLWGNLFIKQHVLPTISRSILTPSGIIIANGFFHTEGETIGVSTAPEAIASLLLLLGCTALMLYVLWGGLRWRQARQ